MAKQLNHTADYLAIEGSTHKYEQREPASPHRTTTLPQVRANHKPHAVTGHLPQIYMQAEGKDNGKQESAPLPSDETIPSMPVAELKAKLAESAKEKTEKPDILIIEDTLELAEVIQATLESAGMKAEFVSHGAKGLDKIKEHTPDVLLLDIGLPDMTGWKMLEELRAWKKSDNDMPAVVVITAYGDPANRLIGKLQGIHSYLIKPFTPDEVEKVVRKALAAANEAKGDGSKDDKTSTK